MSTWYNFKMTSWGHVPYSSSPIAKYYIYLVIAADKLDGCMVHVADESHSHISW